MIDECGKTNTHSSNWLTRKLHYLLVLFGETMVHAMMYVDVKLDIIEGWHIHHEVSRQQVFKQLTITVPICRYMGHTEECQASTIKLCTLSSAPVGMVQKQYLILRLCVCAPIQLSTLTTFHIYMIVICLMIYLSYALQVSDKPKLLLHNCAGWFILPQCESLGFLWFFWLCVY